MQGNLTHMMANECPWGGEALSVKDPGERLSQEIDNFISYIGPTPEETRFREDAIKEISNTVKSLWPSTQVQVYGSFRTGLVLPSSDVDLCVKTLEALEPRKARSRLFQLRNALSRRNLTTDTIVIARKNMKAISLFHNRSLYRINVPILATNMIQSRIAADVCLNTESESTLTTMEWLNFYPDLKTLYLVLKHGLSSLKHDENKQESIGQRLLGFLDFWADFNFNVKGIYLTNGGGYFDKKSKPDDSPLHVPNVLVIEDPNLKDNNIGRATSLLDGVKEGFRKAHRLLQDRIESAKDGSILSAFILLPKSIDGARPVGIDYNLESLEYNKLPVDLVSTRDAVRIALSKSSKNKRKRDVYNDDGRGKKRNKNNRKNIPK